MAVVPLKKQKPVTVGGLIDQMSALREERRKLSEQDRELSAKYEALEAQLIELMDAQGMPKANGTSASASVSENVNFNINDWEAFMAHVARLKLFHLVQRRVSAPAARELFESKGKVPGLTPFVKRTINLRNTPA